MSTIDPLPIKEIDGKVFFSDGHSRAFAYYLMGYEEIPVYWDNDNLDWSAYMICVNWCIKSGVKTIADLTGQVISPAQFQELWIDRCQKLHKD